MGSSGNDIASTRRTTLSIGAGVAVAFLLWGVFSSLRAPYGWWTNHVFEAPLWLEQDPGYWYMASSHESLHEGTVFAGHPGLSLRLILHAIQKVNYLGFARVTAGTGDYSAYTARTLPRVYVMAKLAMTLLHLVSFPLLFRFAKRLSCSDRAATISTLAYASSWPVLFYATRVSVEPLVVIFFLGTFLSCWSCRERMEEGANARASGYAFLAALMAVSGFFTKLHFHFALPLWALLSLLARPLRSQDRMSGARSRVLVAGVFLTSALVAAAAHSSLIDWNEFVRLWTMASETATGEATMAADSLSTQVATRIGAMATAMASAYRDGFVAKIFSGPTSFGIFLHCEWAFLLLAGLGALDFSVRNRGQRGLLLWLGAYTLTPIPVVAFRLLLNPTSFHYFFLHMVLASVFVGYLLDRALEMLWRSRRPRFEPAILVGAVALLHLAAAQAALDSKLADVRTYNREWRALDQALGQVGVTERVGVVTDVEPHPYHYVVNQTMFVWMSTWRVPLTMAIRDSLHFVGHQGRSHDAVAAELSKAGVAIVVDFRGDSGARGPARLEEWAEPQEP